jgi:ubiquinone biosynthesis protein
VKRLSRILKIIQVFARYRLDTLFLSLSLPWYIKLCFWLLPWRLFISASKPEAVRIRFALEA